MKFRCWMALAALPVLAVAHAQEKPPTPIRPAPAAPAKAPSQADLKTMRDEKLALPVFKKAPWTFDYDQARAEAKKTGKPIFGYFSRSYAH